jgi:D-tyrosyl-tRNA(Tyr) deacylase
MEPTDTDDSVTRMATKLLDYRVFADDHGKMNLSLRATGGGLLLVSQFTLAADTASGLRPSFSNAAPPALAEPRFEALCAACRAAHAGAVESGRFRAHMQVALVNDGPVTFLLRA